MGLQLNLALLATSSNALRLHFPGLDLQLFTSKHSETNSHTARSIEHKNLKLAVR